jgi:deazaflavin-dependent oxidoreductase (nitroreductase family)
MYQGLGEGYAIFASKEGAPNNPDWFHNLLANPDVTVEVGSETILVTARVAEGEEREPIWEQQKADHTNFADYEERTDREIPVMILEPR